MQTIGNAPIHRALVLVVSSGAALFSTSVAAQVCDSPPRVVAPQAVCQINQPCNITIDLENDVTMNAPTSAQATLTSTGEIACGNTCILGSSTPAGFVCVLATTSPGSCRWVLANFGVQGALGDGEIVVVPVTCTQAGTYSLELGDVVLADSQGNPLTGACGAAGTLECRDTPTTTSTTSTTTSSSTTTTTLDCCLSDLDGDGESDATDRCPASPLGEPVDSDGCTNAEYCSGFDVRTAHGARACRWADWRNDEPLMRWHDRDCAPRRRGGARCVAIGW